MAERESELFSPRIAQEVLGASTAFLHEEELGEGIRFTTASGSTLDVYLADNQPTAVFVDNGRGTMGAITSPPLEPDHGSDWIAFKGKTEDGIVHLAAIRKTGDVTVRASGPTEVYRAEQADKEALEEQLNPRPSVPELPADATPDQLAAWVTQWYGSLPADMRERIGPPPGLASAEPGPSDAGQAEGAGAARQERGVPVEFSGRLGRKPLVTEVKGKPRVKLAVGEHYEDEADGTEKTRWHEVWTLDRIGPKVAGMVEAGTLDKGIDVYVKGYQHRHPPTGKQTEGAPFVRAFVVSPIQQRQRPH